jgi:hypothetical protein
MLTFNHISPNKYKNSLNIILFYLGALIFPHQVISMMQTTPGTPAASPANQPPLAIYADPSTLEKRELESFNSYMQACATYRQTQERLVSLTEKLAHYTPTQTQISLEEQEKFRQHAQLELLALKEIVKQLEESNKKAATLIEKTQRSIAEERKKLRSDCERRAQECAFLEEQETTRHVYRWHLPDFPELKIQSPTQENARSHKKSHKKQRRN